MFKCDVTMGLLVLMTDPIMKSQTNRFKFLQQ